MAQLAHLSKQSVQEWLPPNQSFQNLRVFKIDGAKNEVYMEGLAIRGFPTLYLFPKNQKTNPIEYDGERTFEAMLEFLAVHLHKDSDEL